ncbi:MAG: hypothetical protein ACK5IQ_09010 [Bacteroidales bacterium]
MPYAIGYKRTANKRTSLRGVGDEAISYNKEQIATLTLAMTIDDGHNVRAEHFLPGCQSEDPKTQTSNIRASE